MNRKLWQYLCRLLEGLERISGVEPESMTWQAIIMPLYYIRLYAPGPAIYFSF